MGFWIEAEDVALSGKMVVANNCQPVGVLFSIPPDDTVRDLRHPTPIRPVFLTAKSTRALSYPHGFSGVGYRMDRRFFARGHNRWRMNHLG